MICELTAENIKNLDNSQLKTIEFFENRYEEPIRILSLVKHSLNPIQIIVKQDDEFQAFMSCRDHNGAYFLCAFMAGELNKDEIIEKSKHYLQYINSLNLQQML